jgi:hypothetical protein
MKKLLQFSLLTFIFFSCSNSTTFNLEATTDHKNDQKVFLIQIDENNRPQAIDSTLVIEGRFSFSDSIAIPEMHYIVFDKQRENLPVILEPGKITDKIKNIYLQKHNKIFAKIIAKNQNKNKVNSKMNNPDSNANYNAFNKSTNSSSSSDSMDYSNEDSNNYARGTFVDEILTEHSLCLMLIFAVLLFIGIYVIPTPQVSAARTTTKKKKRPTRNSIYIRIGPTSS